MLHLALKESRPRLAVENLLVGGLCVLLGFRGLHPGPDWANVFCIGVGLFLIVFPSAVYFYRKRKWIKAMRAINRLGL